jgi:hypothetical protein
MLDGDDVDWGQVDIGRFAAIGGAFTLTLDALIYPLEVMKTKLQVQARASVSAACGQGRRHAMRGKGVGGGGGGRAWDGRA